MEVINTKQAADILGCSTGHVAHMIRNNVITTAFVGCADGYVGKPGYRMYREEIENLALTRAKKKEVAKVKKHVVHKEQKSNNQDVKKALDDVLVALELLSEAVAKLKEEWL
ncbi:MAG: hypothetical protein ACI4DK_13430 [Lachnospiraceae bacterium]